ncbi:hypothetical protein IB232_09125 [Pseudomonas sp. PDM15]|uniref:hypothetical protein n=1 Tax=Pseudomonas sp. PDM15 TaxID=2769303 RepID=UPI0017822000|nr:hypothetical protein [Pseudomonas sp. PDM15]MBD9425478.1 hypothetical protein [Pseudomonas sp. PDM15]
MKKIISSILLTFIGGCATYKVEMTDNASAAKMMLNPDAPILVKQENLHPEGFQCFEPMLFVLTFGLIPTHCADTYSASTITDQQKIVPLGSFKITTIGGWAALIIAPLPQWRLGSPDKPEIEMKQIISHK